MQKLQTIPQAQQTESDCTKALEKCIQMCRKCKNSCMSTGATECSSACEVCLMTCAALLSCCQTKCHEINGEVGLDVKQQLMEAVVAACKHCAILCSEHDHAHCKSCAKACLGCIDALESTVEARSYGYRRQQVSSVNEALNLLKNRNYAPDEAILKNKNTKWVITKRGDKFDVNTADHNFIKAKGDASTAKQINDHINFWS